MAEPQRRGNRIGFHEYGNRGVVDDAGIRRLIDSEIAANPRIKIISRGLIGGDPFAGDPFGGAAGARRDATERDNLVAMLGTIDRAFSILLDHFNDLVDPEFQALNSFQPIIAERIFHKRITQAQAYIYANFSDPAFSRMLGVHGLLGNELLMKKQNLDWFANRLFIYDWGQWFDQNIRKRFSRIAEPLLGVINSILQSMNFVPGAAAAGEIKEHFHAAYTFTAAAIGN